jgi:hypothetical protein
MPRDAQHGVGERVTPLLSEHPDAADSLDGIRSGGCGAEGERGGSAADVQAALDRLVEQQLIARDRSAGMPSVYRSTRRPNGRSRTTCAPLIHGARSDAWSR